MELHSCSPNQFLFLVFLHSLRNAAFHFQSKIRNLNFQSPAYSYPSRGRNRRFRQRDVEQPDDFKSKEENKRELLTLQKELFV